MSEQPIDNFLGRLEGVSPRGSSGKAWKGCCPAHDDKKRSLGIQVADDGLVLFKCYKGCTFDEVLAVLGMTAKDLRVADINKYSGLTIAMISLSKNISGVYLQTVGVTNSSYTKGIEIAYRDVDGSELFRRTRSTLRAKDGTRQPEGVSLKPYGLWLLDDFKKWDKPLILVEGESDCWALWFHKWPALGIPGSGTVKALQPDHVKGFKSIVIWQEPDGGGDSFAATAVQRLKDFAFDGEIKVIRADKDAKDPSDIQAQLEESFSDYMTERVAQAEGPEVAGTVKPDKTPAMVASAGFHKSPFPWGQFEMTDIGNSHRLAWLMKGDLVYIPEWERYHIWDGVRWQEDKSRKIWRDAERAIMGIWHEASEAPSVESSDAMRRWWTKSQSLGKLRAMVDGVQHVTAASYDQFDQRHHLFNAANGTINLQTGQFREASREDWLTVKSNVVYDPDAKCPRWERFLREIFWVDPMNPDMGSRTSIIEFLQVFFGYSATGHTNRAVLPIFYGSGSNGKSVVIKMIQAVLGKAYCTPAAPGLLIRKKGNQQDHPTAIADLFGKRLVYTVETSDNQAMNDELVKQLTGDDEVKARRMNENFWPFSPTHKLVMATNYKPRIAADDDGMWRRIALIPFSVSFWDSSSKEPGPEHLRADDHLKDALMAERPGILNWIIAGAMKYFRDGLVIPNEVQNETSEYREQEDTLIPFIVEATEPKESHVITKKDMYDHYIKWCTAVNLKYPFSSHKLTTLLKKRGWQHKKINNIWHWVGIMPKTNTVSDTDF